MKLPPKNKTSYVFDNEQDKRIFNKLSEFRKAKIGKEQEKLISFLYSQLEKNWRDPLEKYIDQLLKSFRK
jgi:hypothetical protein